MNINALNPIDGMAVNTVRPLQSRFLAQATQCEKTYQSLIKEFNTPNGLGSHLKALQDMKSRIAEIRGILQSDVLSPLGVQYRLEMLGLEKAAQLKAEALQKPAARWLRDVKSFLHDCKDELQDTEEYEALKKTAEALEQALKFNNWDKALLNWHKFENLLYKLNRFLSPGGLPVRPGEAPILRPVPAL